MIDSENDTTARSALTDPYRCATGQQATRRLALAGPWRLDSQKARGKQQFEPKTQFVGIKLIAHASTGWRYTASLIVSSTPTNSRPRAWRRARSLIPGFRSPTWPTWNWARTRQKAGLQRLLWLAEARQIWSEAGERACESLVGRERSHSRRPVVRLLPRLLLVCARLECVRDTLIILTPTSG